MTMDCNDFLKHVEGFLNGELPAFERREAEAHLAACASCRRLAAPPVEPPGDLTGSILALTSGSPCGQSEHLLCDHVDGASAPADAELMRQHLEHCADCAALARVLVRMSETLPELAEVEPDPAFLPDVLRATLPARVRAGRRLAAWSESWRRLLQRPRIAWEGAYLGTIVMVLLFGVPGSPLAAVPRQALELARTDPAHELKAPVVEIEIRITNGFKDARGALRRIKADLGTVWSDLASDKASDEDETPTAERTPRGDRT